MRKVVVLLIRSPVLDATATKRRRECCVKVHGRTAPACWHRGQIMTAVAVLPHPKRAADRSGRGERMGGALIGPLPATR
jgi:hypothetical protein